MNHQQQSVVADLQRLLANCGAAQTCEVSVRLVGQWLNKLTAPVGPTSAPVAGEAQKPAGRILYSGKGNQTIFRTYRGADIPNGWHDVYLSPAAAAPQASETKL